MMRVNVIHKDIKEFLGKLDDKSYAEALKILELLSDKGHEIRMPFSKKVLKNIYELRIKSIQNIRIFYTFRNDEIFLLNAVIKKSQKLIKKDLEVAIHREKWLH